MCSTCDCQGQKHDLKGDRRRKRHRHHRRAAPSQPVRPSFVAAAREPAAVPYTTRSYTWIASKRRGCINCMSPQIITTPYLNFEVYVAQTFSFPFTCYILDVLCRQPIKLFQVVSTSEFHEY